MPNVRAQKPCGKNVSAVSPVRYGMRIATVMVFGTKASTRHEVPKIVCSAIRVYLRPIRPSIIKNKRKVPGISQSCARAKLVKRSPWIL